MSDNKGSNRNNPDKPETVVNTQDENAINSVAKTTVANNDAVTIGVLLSRSSDHTLFYDALAQAKLIDSLNNPDLKLTVFAPTGDNANSFLRNLMDNKTPHELKNILECHIIAVEYTLDQLRDLSNISSINDKNLPIKIGTDNEVSINDVTIYPDSVVLDASNGIVYSIGAVFMPPTDNDGNQPTDNSDLADQVASNSEGIAGNKVNIEANDAVISTNAANISSNDTDIEANATNVSDVLAQLKIIQENITTLNNNVTALNGRVSAVEESIA